MIRPTEEDLVMFVFKSRCMWLLQPPKQGFYETGNMGEANHMSHNVQKY